MVSIPTHKPSGRVPYPVVLVEGEEKAGKSYAAALLSSSSLVGQTYWIDLGEGSAEEYGAIEGARYLVVEHDGTWAQILARVMAVRDEARRANDAHEPPVVLVIDSMSAVWEGLKDWASERAAKSDSNKRRLAADPNAEVNVSMNYWNDSAKRYRRLMTLLLTFPGIVVLTARGKVVAKLDANGKPIEGQKDYSVEGHKTLAYDATVWLRLFRNRPPIVVGARSVHVGLVPGKDDPKPIEHEPDNLLEWLVFTALKVDPTTAQTREVVDVTGGDLTPEERTEEVEGKPSDETTLADCQADVGAAVAAGDRDSAKRLWELIGQHTFDGRLSARDAANLRDQLKATFTGAAA